MIISMLKSGGNSPSLSPIFPGIISVHQECGWWQYMYAPFSHPQKKCLAFFGSLSFFCGFWNVWNAPLCTGWNPIDQKKQSVQFSRSRKEKQSQYRYLHGIRASNQSTINMKSCRPELEKSCSDLNHRPLARWICTQMTFSKYTNI